ncbi:GspH/FimT family pseudopilin [Lysobacter sp. A03]|uniref:GspH/FimT family pseudopilin n=1 Tax=Lysobacter sp. A03 TaxID=1199154 RepID=UPI0005C73C7F|nr:GspH/FimT family pseudopilin [Lysobacter sp. A03]
MHSTYAHHPERNRSRRSAGFTLVELVITVVVLAIIAAIAFPSFTTVQNSSRITSQVNSLVSAVQQARMEAVRLGRPVSLCRSTDGATCAGAGQWDQWLILAPASGGQPAEVLQSSRAHPSVQITSEVQQVTFGSNGLARGADGGLLATTMTVCLPTTKPAENQRRLAIASGSRVSTTSIDGAGECP